MCCVEMRVLRRHAYSCVLLFIGTARADDAIYHVYALAFTHVGRCTRALLHGAACLHVRAHLCIRVYCYGHMSNASRVLHGAAWCCMVLHGAAWCCMVLHGAAWCCMVLHGAACCTTARIPTCMPIAHVAHVAHARRTRYRAHHSNNMHITLMTTQYVHHAHE